MLTFLLIISTIKTNLKLINAIAFLATPSSSPFIGTPDLPSPIRQIILNDIKSEPTESLDILPQKLGTESNIIDNSHPAAEWNMVSTNSNHDSSSSSTSSSSTLQINLKAVNQLTEVNENMYKKLDTLNSTVEILQYQMTGLRSVIRQHRDEIKTLSKPHSSPIPPRFNNKFQTYGYNRYNTPVHSNNRYRSRSPINSSTKKQDPSLITQENNN
jgi:hypothetical protein